MQLLSEYYCWGRKIILLCLIIFFKDNYASDELSKVVKGAICVVGAYILYKEARFIVAWHSYYRAKMDRELKLYQIAWDIIPPLDSEAWRLQSQQIIEKKNISRARIGETIIIRSLSNLLQKASKINS
jgi:hypothetical protein